MKKFTLFLASLFLTIGAMAQAELPAEGSFFRLKNTTSGLYMTVDSYNSGNQDAGGVNIREKNTEDLSKQVFRLKSNGDKYHILTFDNNVLSTFSAWGFRAEAIYSNADLTIEAEEGDIWKLKGTKGYIGTNNNATSDGSILYSNHGAEKQNIYWMFEEVTTEEAELAASQVMPMPSPFSPNNNSCYTVTAANGGGSWYSDESALNSTGKMSVTESLEDVNQQFAFLKSEITGNYYLYSVGKGQFVIDNGNYTAYSESPVENAITTILSGTISYIYNTVIQLGGNHIGISNGYTPAVIAFYNSLSDTGNCSKITFAKTFDATEALAKIDVYEATAKKAELQTLIDAAKQYTFGTEVGAYTQAAIETLAAAILAAEEAYNNPTTTTTQAIEATKTLQNVIDNLAIVLPSADKFYKIVKYDDATKVVYIENNDLKGNWGENTTPASVWAFEQGATDGKFYLRNVGTGSYINGYARNNTIYGGDKKDETSVILYDASKRQVGIAPNDGEHFNRASGRLCAWTDYFADSNSAWLIEEVTEFAHTLTVGAAGYTTLVLGYNATVPAIEGEGNGVFTATVNGEWIDLTAVEAGSVLPANTAVIIKAAAGTELSFAYSAEPAAEVTTALSGTLYDKNIAPGEGNTAYVLSMQNEVVGFYKAALNQADNKAFKNNANKAYLVVEGAELAAYSFRFPGTTGVEEITENREQSTVIYDLTGRRVEAITAPGIYIVNGKKVLVK